jgi:AcrR family transcriptional regulator
MSPTARSTVKDQSSEGIRERILAAAMDVLREEGIQGLSQVQVARRADVRQSHLTYYFPKRNDLIEAVAMQFIEHAFGALDKAAAAAPRDDLPAVLLRAAAAIADEGHMRMFTGVIVEADGNAELRSTLVKVTKQLQATIASRLAGEDAMERARLVLASLWGMGLYDFFVRPRRRSPLVESLLACLGAPSR